MILVVTAHNHPSSTTHIPHREIGRVDLRDDLRQHVALLPDQRGGDPEQRAWPTGPARCRPPARETVSKNFSPTALILPPVSTTKGTKLLWSLYFATLMSLYNAAARPGVWAVPAASRRGVPGHTTPTSASQMVPPRCTLLSARRWSPGPSGAPSRLQRGLNAWDALKRIPQGVADAVVAVGHPHPPPPAVESVQGLTGERRAGLVGLVALDDPLRPRAAPLPQHAGDSEAEPQDLAETRVWHLLVSHRGHRLDDHFRTRARGLQRTRGSEEIVVLEYCNIILLDLLHVLLLRY